MHKCVFCGAGLDHAHVNPWLTTTNRVAYECPLRGGVPECREGQVWYERCTVVSDEQIWYTHDGIVRGGYRELRAEIEALPVEERL